MRTRMLAQQPAPGTNPSDMDTDHEQVSSNDGASSEEETDTPFPVLSDKDIHVIAYGWDSSNFDDLDVIAALERLELPLQCKLEPRTVNGVPLVDMILSSLDTFT